MLLLHSQTLQVRLLSDPLECLDTDSGWHGRHNWFPGCDSFSVWDFGYEGSPRPIVPHVAFVLHDFSTRFGIWRYAVHELGGAGIGPPFAEAAFWAADRPQRPQRPPPPLPLDVPLLEEELWPAEEPQSPYGSHTTLPSSPWLLDSSSGPSAGRPYPSEEETH